jgi:hypothetical protein
MILSPSTPQEDTVFNTFKQQLYMKNQMAVLQTIHYATSQRIELKQYFLVYTSVFQVFKTDQRIVHLLMKPIACNEMLHAETLNASDDGNHQKHASMSLQPSVATVSVAKQAQDIMNSTPYMSLDQLMNSEVSDVTYDVDGQPLTCIKVI